MPNGIQPDWERSILAFKYSPLEDEVTAEIRQKLLDILDEQVSDNILNEQDALLLSLRLGLRDGKCQTLAEISCTINISREHLRQRQHLALHRKIKDPTFFRFLEMYSQRVKLPRGVEHHCHK